MKAMRRLFDLIRASAAGLILGLVLLAMGSSSSFALTPGDIESDLVSGSRRLISLGEAMASLKVPSVSYALIDQDRIAFTRAVGGGATPETLFQAASLSKFVTAVGAMRMVDHERLKLDQDVNAKLTTWHVPENAFDREHPVTLRGLLSMTGGINVPGFAGYEVGAKLPTLSEILDGTPPATSPPVTVVSVPGTRYAYSGGGYEIAEALMSDVAQAPFTTLMDDLVLNPAGMVHSTFVQPLPAARESETAAGHFGDGKEMPGRWHVIPEHAAGGLWSTPSDLAELLLLVGRAWRGESHLFLSPDAAREMLTRQNGGPYGLGAAIGDEDGGAPILMKRGQNPGYQAYLLLLPGRGQGIVVMTNSDNGSKLAEMLIRRVGELLGWPLPTQLPD